jgi:hypothetical protein
VLLATGAGCADWEEDASAPATRLCSDAWYQAVEAQLASGDGQGHGPDIGSDEWQSVIEFRLGVRGQPDVPARDSLAWCRYIDQRLAARR